MEVIPGFTFFFIVFPEGLLVTSLGLIMIGLRPHLRGLLYVGLLYPICAYTMRLLLPVGMHTLGILICLAGIIMLAYRLPAKKAFAVSVIALLSVVLVEALTIPLLIRIFSLTVTEILAHPWLHIMAVLPEQLILLAAVLLGLRFRSYTQHSN